MSTTTPNDSRLDPTRNGDQHRRRLTTETKASTKTTELIVYIAAVIAVIITAIVIGDSSGRGGDSFGGSEAMRYITWLTIGYMVARGLAKSGSREAYDSHDN